MADYYSILAQAVGALEPNTAMARRQLYDRGRSAMVSKLQAAMPPFPGADIAAAKIAFESAVARVEAEALERNAPTPAKEAPPLSPDSEAGGRRLERGATRSGASTGRDTWLTDLLERASDGADNGQSYAPRRARDAERE
jgi:hypothetical protein